MFRPQDSKNKPRSALALLEVIFHSAVRNVRKTQGNAIIGLLLNIFQTVLLIAGFWVMMYLLGMRSNAIRGDFALYLMSGIFMYMTHTKTMGAVSGAEGPTSQMMKHSPMNTIISIAASALSALYTQALSAIVVLYFYHAAFTPIQIHNPVGMVAMFMLSWASGIALGMIVLAATPWNPHVMGIVSSIYQRANMIASGKMFVANAMPTATLKVFDWNPLFHTIDQGRGFIFLNYHPHYSSISYPIKVTLICMMIGLMGEFFTRQHASASWSAGK